MENQKTASWNLRTRISGLLHRESSSDVEFLVGLACKRYLGHKVILAAGSPVFETMFFGKLKQKSPVQIPDVTSRGFALMLQYLYSDSVAIQNESDAFEAAYSAKKYMIKPLFAVCENFLMEKLVLAPGNVLALHEEASLLEMKNLQDYCLRYVSRNARTIFLSKSFVKASKDTFQDVLSLDLMDIESEKEVIEALWLWGERQCKEKSLDCTNENVRTCTKEFLKHIRFFALKMEDLVNVLEQCQVLDTCDELALLWNFAMPRSRKPIAMSSDICTDSRTRSISNSSKIHLPGLYFYNGNMADFLIENRQTQFDITVTGAPVTVIGAVIAFKPIPCYSSNDRKLEVNVLADNCSTAVQSSAKSKFKAEELAEEHQQTLLLKDYIVIEEGQVLSLTVTVNGEGVRFMQCPEDILCYDLGESEVCLKFSQNRDRHEQLFPIKELMIV